jgi:hypothetical protein
MRKLGNVRRTKDVVDESTGIALIALGFDKGSHISQYVIVRDIRAWIIERRLHFGTEPTVVAGGLLFGFNLRNDGGKFGAHRVTSGINTEQSNR